LRDQRGLRDADIGMGNEKAVNQLIAHHSIVFQPQKLLVSVSTSPWQLGQYVTYDLRRVFALQGLQADREIRDSLLTITADTSLNTADYQNFVQFRQIKEQLRRGYCRRPRCGKIYPAEPCLLPYLRAGRRLSF
jgi:isopenicillin-N N-acyltransferase-like protein